MWAVQYRSSGGPKVLRLEKAPRPVLRPGQVLVRTLASGVSRVDVLYRRAVVCRTESRCPSGRDSTLSVRSWPAAAVRSRSGTGSPWCWVSNRCEAGARRSSCSRSSHRAAAGSPPDTCRPSRTAHSCWEGSPPCALCATACGSGAATVCWSWVRAGRWGWRRFRSHAVAGRRSMPSRAGRRSSAAGAWAPSTCATTAARRPRRCGARAPTTAWSWRPGAPRRGSGRLAAGRRRLLAPVGARRDARRGAQRAHRRGSRLRRPHLVGAQDRGRRARTRRRAALRSGRGRARARRARLGRDVRRPDHRSPGCAGALSDVQACGAEGPSAEPDAVRPPAALEGTRV